MSNQKQPNVCKHSFIHFSLHQWWRVPDILKEFLLDIFLDSAVSLFLQRSSTQHFNVLHLDCQFGTNHWHITRVGFKPTTSATKRIGVTCKYSPAWCKPCGLHAGEWMTPSLPRTSWCHQWTPWRGVPASWCSPSPCRRLWVAGVQRRRGAAVAWCELGVGGWYWGPWRWWLEDPLAWGALSGDGKEPEERGEGWAKFLWKAVLKLEEGEN